MFQDDELVRDELLDDQANIETTNVQKTLKSRHRSRKAD